MRKQAFVLAGLASAAITANTQAAFIEVTEFIDGTVDGTWQTVVLAVSGLTDRLDAINGTAGVGENPMSFITGDGSNLYNHDTWISGPFIFNGEAGLASVDADFAGFFNAKYDSGVLTPFQKDIFVNDTSLTAGFATEIGSFSFSNGASDSSTNIAVFDGDLDNPIFPSSVDVFRLTWKRNTTLFVEFNVQTTVTTSIGGTTNEALNILLPAIPAPGAFALLGLAGLVGRPRRRRG
ncbi:MAG: hypothetical protein IID30_15755 [Planctomycetes bacterium]|nr:hypothetical protein [Planctomycetota bacterium]